MASHTTRAPRGLVSLGLHCFLRLERALCWRSGRCLAGVAFSVTQLPSILKRCKERTGREQRLAYAYAVCLSQIIVPCVTQMEYSLCL